MDIPYTTRKILSIYRKGETMSNLIDLTGQRFGKLTVIRNSGKRSKSRGVYWVCKCDCGNEKVLYSQHLKHNYVRSCGCEIKIDCLDGTRLRNLNKTMLNSNSSGHKGVSFRKKNNKYEAYIGFKGTKKHLGYYRDIKDAIKARKEAEEKYFTPILEKYGRI